MICVNFVFIWYKINFNFCLKEAINKQGNFKILLKYFTLITTTYRESKWKDLIKNENKKHELRNICHFRIIENVTPNNNRYFGKNWNCPKIVTKLILSMATCFEEHHSLKLSRGKKL